MAATVRFLLDGETVALTDPDPQMTVLTLLRTRLNRTGTKEGCAEGDCGACTVVVAERDGGAIVRRAVNACIALVPQLDGKALFTVESLGREGALHPVQQAMADAHATQCGFCTPGFVMTIYAACHAPEPPADIDALLAGNLCRCTGYGPIVAAARTALAAKHDAASADAALGAQLATIARRDTLDFSGRDAVTGAPRRFVAPRSADELNRILTAHPDATLVAGATDVGVWIAKRTRPVGMIVSLDRIAALKSIRRSGGELVIGAGVCYADAAAHIARLYPSFGALIERIGAVQVRNAGTIGGNIANASPIGDTPPALIAAGARLALASLGGTRLIALEDYFLGPGKQDRRPGEYIAAIHVPKPRKDAAFRVYKVAKRHDQDISAVCGAFALDIADGAIAAARIAYGGMAATPRRAPHAEAALTGATLTTDSFARAAAALAQDFTPISDHRGGAAYRARVAANLLLRLGADLTEATGAAPLQVRHG